MRKPDKTRVLSAIRHIESNEVPFVEQEPDPLFMEKLLGRDLPRCFSVDMPADITVACAKKLCTDMVLFMEVWQLGRKTVKDSNGFTHYVDGTIKTYDDLEKITYPDLKKIRKRLEELLEKTEGTGIGIIYFPNPVPHTVTTAVGYVDYYIKILEDPAFIHEFQSSLMDYSLQELEMVLQYPIDMVELGLGQCSKSGPMISLEMFYEFEFPYMREFIQRVKDKGLPCGIHTDGDNTLLMPEFVKLGFDIINPIEPCGQQNIYKIKEMYGDKIALHGNIDVPGVLESGSPEEVARDVLYHIEKLAIGGGYICGCSHNLTAITPMENFLAMRDTVCKYRF